MRYKKRQITALKPDGTEFTGNYAEWAEINNDTIGAIQRRMSVRNRQIRDGIEPYSIENVVGTEKLKGQNRKRVKPIPREIKTKGYKSQAMSRVHRGFLFRESARVVAALNSMELNYG